ncbi:purine-nucleoside phosphorylase [Oceanicella actignis]|uniref:purine-nucleoside phosphorylase n=1 Tax=Oceanicella actignis TaxID=1189325 RepID=UPI0011E6875B|nr:purine-nucleoside phosphorylase [Oceanicella actignis]TYO88858.1 purine-nucleoside phosphorylase [Oceanicella actignis]
MTDAERTLDAAAGRLAELGPIEAALILGSGLGALADQVQEARALPYAELPGFPVSTAPGHAGRFVVGRLHGRRVALMQGRLHLYEGWSAAQIALPVRLLRRMGARTLVITNAAGALNPDLKPGAPMLIADHLNFTGANPLTGPNDERIGPRFPDMSRAYDPELRALARAAAAEAGEPLAEGVYAGVAGPSLETSAERRFLRMAGGDAVGMSTVVEAIAANHCGMRVAAISAITNAADGGPDQQPDTIEEVLANAAVAGEKIGRILARLIPALP